MKFITGLLDNIKSKGRHGDTELRIVDNEVSHVNKDEAYLIDNYGLLGEVVTQEIGAGTINPNTGLREYHEGSWKTGFVAHPYHHTNWWVGDINSAAQGLVDFTENVFEFGEDVLSEGLLDTVYDRTINSMRDDIAGGLTSISQNITKPEDLEYDLNQIIIDGKVIEKPSRAKVMEFINPETNTLTDPQGLATYIRELNPNMTMFKGLSDTELIQKFTQYAPDMFASQEDIHDTREKYTSDARTRIKKAGEETMQMDFAMGASGITRHGDPNRKITEGLYEDMSKMHKQKSKDIEDLKQDDIDTFGDYVYGLTDADSEYGIKGGTY
tara:strand:+ start:156 stop:1133 length:978 start_codon:yes stop_codon:yes gene_type:complete